MPKIPGMRLIVEEKGECSYRANYDYAFYKERDLSGYLLDSITSNFLKGDWQLKNGKTEDGLEVLNFYTEKAGVQETMIVEITFEEGRGNLLSFNYQWPPCSDR